MTSTTTVTPLQVLDAAIERLSREDGYINTDYHDEGYVADSKAHCAIGGIEHGIWKLLREDVTGYREDVAYTGSSNPDHRSRELPAAVAARPSIQVYGQVMKVLNEEAFRMFPNGVGKSPVPAYDVEDVSIHSTKADVLAVFQAARRRIHAEQA